MVARKIGERYDIFRPPLDDPYDLVTCSYPHRIGVMDKIPVANPKLKDLVGNKPIRVVEKNDKFIIEILRSFCLNGGHVFDGFGGTLTTAIACIRTGRGCVVMEKDEKCFRLALRRLYNVFVNIYGHCFDKGEENVTRLAREELERR